MPVVVYTARHTKSEMFYIGRTTNFLRRQFDHYGALSRGAHRNKLMQLNYDSDNTFTWEQIEVDNVKDATDLELKMIQLHSNNPLMMNVVGRPCTEQRRRALSNTWTSDMKEAASKRTKNIITPEYMTELRYRSSLVNKGSKHSQKAKELMSNAKKGIPKSDQHKQRLSEVCGKAVTIDGITYPSCTAASKSLGVTQATVGNRCRNEKFPNWQFN